MDQVEHAHGKGQNEWAEEQAAVQVQVASDEIEASHQERCEPKTVRRVGLAFRSTMLLTAIAPSEMKCATLRPKATRSLTRSMPNRKTPAVRRYCPQDGRIGHAATAPLYQYLSTGASRRRGHRSRRQ